MIFGTFRAHIIPHILLQMPYERIFYLWDTQMATYHDLKHGHEFPVPENGIEHVSHIHISTKCVCTTNLPLKWRPSWIFAHRESSGQGKIGENMFLYSRDVRH